MVIFFSKAALVILIFLILLWIVSVIIKNAGIVDVFWGTGFVIVNMVYFLLLDEIYTRHILVLALVSIWGLRLSIYLGIRNIGKPEDYRYQEFRRNYGEDRYWWVSFFQVFLLQGLLIMLISLPLLGVTYSSHSDDLSILDYLACIIWLIGFLFEAVGDYQLSRFKRNPLNKGKVFDSGLWKYTRHPNYFGDSAVWWAFGLFCIASGSYWLAIGSVLMTILIIKVSGVSLLEETIIDRRPEYEEYKRRTSAFFPWFPKKK